MERLELERARFKDLDNSFGGSVALAAAEPFLAQVVRAMVRGSSTGEVRGLLLRTSALFLLDVGWFRYDIGDHDVAQARMQEALSLAHVCGDEVVLCRVLAAMSHHRLHRGQRQEATTLAEAASRLRLGRCRPAVAMAHAMYGMALAALGERRLAERSFARGEAALSRDGSSVPPWLEFDTGGLLGHAAQGYVYANRPADAARLAGQALAQCLPGHRRTMAQRHVILSSAVAASGHREEATHHLARAVDLAWAIGSVRLRDEVLAAASSLPEGVAEDTPARARIEAYVHQTSSSA